MKKKHNETEELTPFSLFFFSKELRLHRREELLRDGRLIRISNWAPRKLAFAGESKRVELAVSLRVWRLVLSAPRHVSSHMETRRRGGSLVEEASRAMLSAKYEGKNHGTFKLLMHSVSEPTDLVLLIVIRDSDENDAPRYTICFKQEVPKELLS